MHSPKTIIQEHIKVYLPLTQAQQSKQILLESNIIFMLLVLKCKFYAAFFVNLYVHQIFFKKNLFSTYIVWLSKQLWVSSRTFSARSHSVLIDPIFQGLPFNPSPVLHRVQKRSGGGDVYQCTSAKSQAPLSTGFSRQEYQSGLSCPPRDLPDPGIQPTCLTSSTLAGRFFYHQCHQQYICSKSDVIESLVPFL